MNFETVIGLEVHAQLNTRTKIFCGCSTEFGASPNSHTCPVCLGMPGVLPVLNREVVEKAIRAGLATNCTVNRESRWDRKNYFYPDLPKGYQISQYEKPICEHGHLDITLADGQEKRIGITRIHMEEDAGKSSHDAARPVSRVDLNRTGVPLIEIVSEPDMRSPEEAGAYLRKLHAIVKAIGVCDGNLEEGSFRCDANVSIRPVGQEAFGTRAELKNLNSFKFIEKAIQYEINRQIALVENGDAVVQETRLWDTAKNRTFSMRGKEEAHDYRYFPDPDLLPLIIEDDWIDRVKNEMPELPEDRKKRFIDVHGLPEADADVLIGSMDLADYYEACLETHNSPKPVANWVMGTLLGYLNASGLTIDASPVSPAHMAELVQLIDSDVISGKIAKTVFDAMVETGDAPKFIVEKQGLTQVTDTSAIESVLEAVLARCPDEVAAYKGGKTKLMSFFMGQVMKETKGKANPKVVTELLKKKLS